MVDDVSAPGLSGTSYEPRGHYGASHGEAPITLALDASTYVGTVAVFRGGVLIAEGEAAMRGEQEERLMPAVAATLAQAGCSLPDVTRVVCGAGPGSFTSLRIAGAIAKGVAMGNDAPLFAVSSLALIVAGAQPSLPAGQYVALLDAMRGERYAAVFAVETEGVVRERERLGLIADAEIAATCARLGARAVGPKETLALHPHARGVARLLVDLLTAGATSFDAWEPDYGRLAEAQVKWEAAHGRPLSADTRAV